MRDPEPVRAIVKTSRAILITVSISFLIWLYLMPVCTIYLLSLNVSLSEFVDELYPYSPKTIVTAKVARWIITPKRLSKEHLLHPSQTWDLLLILLGAEKGLPKGLTTLVNKIWSIQAGIPSQVIASFRATNNSLLHPSRGETPPLTGALSNPLVAKSSQALELSEELHDWIACDKAPKGAVSMLNLLSFQPGKQSMYLEYGKAFSQSIGSSRGGVAKLVGRVIPGSCSDSCDEWDEVCLISSKSCRS